MTPARSYPTCDAGAPAMDMTPGNIEKETTIHAIWPTPLVAKTTFASLLCDPVQRMQSHFCAPPARPDAFALATAHRAVGAWPV